MPPVPNVTLNNAVEIPQLGLGVFQVPPASTADTVRAAFEAGYRHIDTAQMYGNEKGVGRAIRRSGLPRDEIFVTTKLNNGRHGRAEAFSAVRESLEQLDLEYVDLVLIHWPLPATNRYVETWQAFEKILSDGWTRAIGVSNFQVAHLERLAAETGTVPAVNQIELHPYLRQPRLREYHREHGIATEAWGPLARGGELLREERVIGMAESYGVSPAQIVLRWHLELGNIVIPKSVRPQRMRENLDVLGFELADDDMATLAELEAGHRTGPDPDRFG